MSQLSNVTEKGRPANTEAQNRSDRELLLDAKNRRLTWFLGAVLFGVVLLKCYVILVSR